MYEYMTGCFLQKVSTFIVNEIEIETNIRTLQAKEGKLNTLGRGRWGGQSLHSCQWRFHRKIYEIQTPNSDIYSRESTSSVQYYVKGQTMST